MWKARRMRKLIRSHDKDGHTCAVEQATITFTEVPPGVGWDTVFQTIENPLPRRPEERGDLLPMSVDPGLIRWNVMEWGPGIEIPRHHTDMLDVDPVIAGSVELILDDGIYSLVPGDCVVAGGIDHAWRAGPEGCRVSSIFFGTPPRSGS